MKPVGIGSVVCFGIVAVAVYSDNSYAQEVEDLVVSGSATIVSDYRFRGVSQTGKDPAFQAGLDLEYKGFYVGTWGSSIDDLAGADAEIDLYGGYIFDLGGGTSLNLGAIAYLYPSGDDVSYYELSGALSFEVSDVSLSVGANYGPDQSNLGDEDNIYLYTSASVPLNDTGFSLFSGFGYEDGAFGNDKLDWTIGLSYDWKNLNLSAAYIDTDDPGENASSTVLVSVGASF